MKYFAYILKVFFSQSSAGLLQKLRKANDAENMFIKLFLEHKKYNTIPN